MRVILSTFLFLLVTSSASADSFKKLKSYWMYGETKDPVTLQKTIKAITIDPNSNGQLFAYCINHNSSLGISGDFFGFSGNKKVTINFDDKEILDYNLSPSQDGKYLMFQDSDYGTIMWNLKKFKKIKMRIYLEHMGDQDYIFQLKGSTKALNKFEDKC
jgi:hypothetical protein